MKYDPNSAVDRPKNMSMLRLSQALPLPVRQRKEEDLGDRIKRVVILNYGRLKIAINDPKNVESIKQTREDRSTGGCKNETHNFSREAPNDCYYKIAANLDASENHGSGRKRNPRTKQFSSSSKRNKATFQKRSTTGDNNPVGRGEPGNI